MALVLSLILIQAEPLFGAPPSGQRLLVRMKADSPFSAQRTLSSLRLFSRSGSEPKGQYLPLTETHLVDVPEDAQAQVVAESLRQDRNVEVVEIDQTIRAHATPNDQYLNLQWPLVKTAPNIGAEQAWSFVHDTQNILIAIIDSGTDLSHPDLTENLWRNEGEIPGNGVDDDGDGYVDNVNGYDFFNRDPLPQDDFGHGTMVFGEIGAVGNNGQGVSGLSWTSRIMALKVLDSSGNSNISTAVEAIEFCIKKGVKIINMSWGYTPNGAPSQVLQQAIQKAGDAGILVITSAGNGNYSGQGVDNDSNPNLANYPSSYPEDNIIAVAATNNNDDLAAFSNYGFNTVDLGAPGVAIYSTYMGNGYEYFTGTSAAAPYATAAAALVWAVNPSLSYADIKRLVLETTDPVNALQGKTLTGGRLNVARALQNSPAQGGTLLLGSSPLPAPDLSSQTGGSSGGCSLASPTSGAFSGWMGMGLMPLIYLRRRLRKSA